MKNRDLARGRFDYLQQSIGAGLWELDHATSALYWSEGMFELLACSLPCTKPSYGFFLSRVHDDDKQVVRDAVRALLIRSQAFAIRHRVVLPSEQVRWVECSGKTWRDEEGHGGVSRGVIRDVTAAVESADALRRSESMVSSFLHISPEAVVLTDQRGTIVTFSDGAELAFRCKRSDVVGKPIESLMPERFREGHRSQFGSFASSAQVALRMSERGEIRARRMSGEEFAAEATVSRLPGVRGELFAVIVRDLSERKAYEAALESAKVRAEAANEAKSAFLATMSHEIRTPMNGVLGMLSVLAMESLTEKQREMVEVAIDAGSGLMEILNDILDYSRIEAGEMQLELSEFDIRSVLKKVQTLHAFKARATGIALDVAVDASVPSVLLGDAARIQQIMHNLVGNAVKFTQKGRVDVRAICEAPREDACALVLSVTDTGIGLSQEQTAVIFERFTQADSSITRRFGGSGLGLSIVKGLVDAMQGCVDVKSSPGSGACFTVRLPVLGAPALNRVRQPREPVLADYAASRWLRVLVAEDNILNADTLRLLLDRKGISVSIARNGEEALKLFHPGRFDLVLLDIQMPVLDGESAVKLIRKLEQASSEPAAIVAAYTAFADAERCIRYAELGFDHILSKPIKTAEVDRLVELALRRSKQQAA